MSKAKFPSTIYVYQINESDIDNLAVANGLEEIPEDQDGNGIATYKLTKTSNFKIRRDLE